MRIIKSIPIAGFMTRPPAAAITLADVKQMVVEHAIIWCATPRPTRS